MEMLYQYIFFFAKIITLMIAVIVTLAAVVGILSRSKESLKNNLKVTKLNKIYQDLTNNILRVSLDKKQFKSHKKQQNKNKSTTRSKAYLLKFQGDIRASSVEQLRQQVTAILQTATPKDEVIVTIHSPGGMVPNYGLAASQLVRIREHNIPLTVCVDQVAASGGYLMAVVANKILAAPFAIIGSIGVVAQLPNFNRLLKKNDIDFEEHTAGEYKRTLTYFGEITKEGKEKFQEGLVEVHDLFKEHVINYRPTINLDEVANGDYWYGSNAKQLNLIDEIITSDDYLLALSEHKDIYLLESESKKTFVEKLTKNVNILAENFNLKQF